MTEQETLVAISSNLLRTSEALATRGEAAQPIAQMFLKQSRQWRKDIKNAQAREVLTVLDETEPQPEALLTAGLLLQNCRHHWY